MALVTATQYAGAELAVVAQYAAVLVCQSMRSRRTICAI